MSVDWPPHFSTREGNRLFRPLLCAEHCCGAPLPLPAPAFSQPVVCVPVITGISGDSHTTVVGPPHETGKGWALAMPPSARGANPWQASAATFGGAARLLTVAPFSCSLL